MSAGLISIVVSRSILSLVGGSARPELMIAPVFWKTNIITNLHAHLSLKL